MNSMTMATARKVAPSGLPMCRRRIWPSVSVWSGMSGRWERVVLRRKSCVMAMPMEAKASEVRSQARNVRSMDETLDSALKQMDNTIVLLN